MVKQPSGKHFTFLNVPAGLSAIEEQCRVKVKKRKPTGHPHYVLIIL